MSITKLDSLAEQKEQLNLYQMQLNDYANEYSRSGCLLFKEETLLYSFQVLEQIINKLETMNKVLQTLYKNNNNPLYKTIMPLALKNWLLGARIKNSIIMAKDCLVLKRPEDVVVEASFDKLLEPDYVYIVKNAQEHFPHLVYKEDETFQIEMYHALTQAALKLGNNKTVISNHLPKDELLRQIEIAELIAKYPTIMENFIDKCDDNIVKLSYYQSLILQDVENAAPTQALSNQVKEYSKTFFEIYRKFIGKLSPLQEKGRLSPQQKVAYIKANYYAYYVRMNTHLGLQRNNIREALKNTSNTKNEEYIRKYLDIAKTEGEQYFAHISQSLLCHDIQEILMDTQAIYEFLNISKKVCTALTNEVSHILLWWHAIKDKSNIRDKDFIYQEIQRYENISSDYYACYNLINNYLTKEDGTKRISPEFDKDYQEMICLFTEYKKERIEISLIDKNICANTKANEKVLLLMDAKPARKPKQSRLIAQETSTEKAKPEPKVKNTNTNEENSVPTKIDNIIQEGQLCIKKQNEQGAFNAFWKAYNLAIYFKDDKGKLKAMDCLCYMSGVGLANQLKLLESLAKNPHKKHEFQEEANALLSNLPKLKSTYDNYFQLADKILLPEEQAGIEFTRETFWKQIITVQTKLSLLLAQNSKKSPRPSKKQAVKSNNNKINQTIPKTQDNLKLVLEKHLDDLAAEKDPSLLPIFKEFTPQQIKINLPLSIQNIFKFLTSINENQYLVGSMVLQLLNQMPIIAHDIDFISNCKTRTNLIHQGFQENPYVKNLYSLFGRFEWPIDLVVLPEEENWLMKSLCSRDFRVAALSCDSEGTIIDPTGQGLEDLKQRRLVMIGSPIVRIKKDPVLILRAIKYMALGFEPDEALLQAIESWKPESDTNFSKLNAVARKHLKTEQALPFLNLLCQFGLLEKMFKLKEKSALMPQLGLYPKRNNPLAQYGLFKNQQISDNHFTNNYNSSL